MKFGKNRAWWLLLGLIMSGCESSCSKAKPNDRAEKVLPGTNPWLSIDPQTIFSHSENFRYHGTLLITLSDESSVRENIEVIGSKPYLYLKKSSDEANFFELFKDEDNYYIKNQNGPYRKNIDNNLLYESIFKDSLNLTAWVIEELGLSEELKAKKQSGESTIHLKDVPLRDTAPLLKKILGLGKNFSNPQSALVSGLIVVDHKSSLPLKANFEVKISGQEQHWLKLESSARFDLAFRKKLEVPLAVADEALKAPINIKPRFLELLESKQVKK